MSTDVKQLIESIQRIAEGSPLFTEVRGLLKEIQRRGGIEGLSLKIGADDESGGDCCTDPNETGEPTDSTAPDISGDAPPDMSGGTPEGWTDCETGQPIQFTPGGFLQPETCKGDCEQPDPTWQEGYYWYITNFNRCNTSGATPQEALVRYYITTGGGTFVPYDVGGVASTDDEGMPTAYWLVDKDGDQTGAPARRVSCPGPQSCNYCTDEAPIISDCQDWEPDSKTNYTLANGCITASTCDTDASEQAKQCNECITICNDQGQERRVCAIGNGQFILYDPSGEHKGGRYDATGERLEVLDPGSNGGYGSIE